ncbi:MAG: replication-associated recombination protein A [Synergistaceae bacterium]|nr:replication-associated recombination protein A [Synergistaceae bacterium]MBQ6738861.1 replication-associated recombination protein A [Synergistaceae bacterium]MBR0075996.1 replication-associated recombination protein A [Synergistaceae bacterium]MBR0080278.1 replication-associated recombination protein A [Synergistaceae bacterium]MBR0252801.1 replication-associated recombination protein A [Synergistaceae bacterium]
MAESLFINPTDEPLAARMRPDSLEDFAGQEHLIAPGKILRRIIDSDKIPSMIFWGPPGVGKTTLARIIATKTKAEFINFSAVTSGIKEIRDVMKQAESNRNFGERTILFVDEIHRFNKAQQDAFLPFVEKGAIILIGATTENPSFEINGALLSRCKVFVLKALNVEDLVKLLQRALKFLGNNFYADDEILKAIAIFSNGDARAALSLLEMAANNTETNSDGKIIITNEILEQCTSRKSLLYDKNGEEHYNLISALHKSMRNSDPDAAVYWLSRMLESGEDPLYIARRVLRFASEDVGLAEPSALSMAVAAYQACHFIGMPECSVHLAQVVIHLSISPKSNSVDVAYNSARNDALKNLAEPVPLHLRNAPTKLMRELEYGKNYKFAHDYDERITNMQCLPENLIGHEYYKPTEQGIEIRYKNRLEQIKEWKRRQ